MISSIPVYPSNDEMTAFASDKTSSNVAQNEEAVRTNINFIEGQPGDTYLVYTYNENDENYKIIETATSDFSYVNSTIYLLDNTGVYVPISTQECSTDSFGNRLITIQNESGQIENRVISQEIEEQEQGTIVSPQIDDYEWITSYDSGNTYIKDLTISALISVITSIATSKMGNVGKTVINGIANVANAYFGFNATWAYYYRIYNTRHSPYNYLIIEETQHTEYYEDAAHTKYLHYTYAEFRDNQY